MIWHLDAVFARIWLHNSGDWTLDPVASAGAPVSLEGPEGQSERDEPVSGTANGFAAG